MADAKKQLVLDLLANDKTAQGTGAAARNIGKVGTAADSAAKSTEKLSGVTVVAGKRTDEFGDQAEDAADHIRHLDREIGKVNQDLVLMAAAMAKAGSKAERLDLAKGIRKSQSELRQLEGGKKILGGLLPSEEEAEKLSVDVGKKTGDGLLSGLSSKLAGAGPLVPILAGAVAAAAPVAGAALAAGLIAGVGAAGIGLGIIGALKSSGDLQAAGKELGSTLMAGIGMSARQHFTGPILTAIGAIKKGWNSIFKDVDRLLSASSKLIMPLVNGALSFGKYITKAMADLVEGAGSPVFSSLGDGLAMIGKELAGMFDMLKDNGVEAGLALRQVFQLVGGAIRTVAIVVNALVESYGFLAKIGAFGKDAQREYIRLEANAKLAAKSNENLAGSFGQVDTSGTSAADSLEELNKQIQDMIDANNELYGSTTDVAQAIADTTKSIKDNGKTVDVNTEKGRENRRALADLADSLRSNYDAYVAVNGAGDGANRVAQKNRDSFIKLAEKAGYAASQARILADKLLGIPNVTRNVKVNGIQKAKDDLAALRARLAGIKNRTVYVRTLFIEERKLKVDNQLGRSGSLEYRATGGPVARGRPYVVGENGPELVVPEAASRVMSAAATRGAFEQRGGRGGGFAGGTVQIELVGPEESRVWFRKMVRTMNILPGVGSAVA